MPTIEELEAELKKERELKLSLENSKTRLTDESFKFKQRAQEAEKLLEDAKNEKLKADGDLEQLLANERESNRKLNETLEVRTKSYVSEKLRATVASKAKDARDVDIILRIPEHRDLLKIDNDTLEVTGVDEYLTKVRESHSFLFDQNKVKNSGQGKPKVDDKNLTPEGYETEMSKPNLTRKEMDAIRLKYGKTLD